MFSIDRKVSQPKSPTICVEYGKGVTSDLCLRNDPRGVKTYESSNIFFPTPNTMIGRQIAFVCAPSQAGKTTFVNHFAKMFQYIYPKLKKIKVFSEKQNDDLEELGSERVPLDESIVENPINPLSLENTLLIFDDVDGIYDRKVRNEVFKLIDRILKLGGGKKCHIIVTYHMLTNHSETRYLLFESNYIVVFPNTGTVNQFRNLFQNYLGIDADQTKKIMCTNSRWVLIHKNHPKYIVYESGCSIL